LPSGVDRERVRRTASRRFHCLSTTFSHVGLVASSQSAMKTRAPEFRGIGNPKADSAELQASSSVCVGAEVVKRIGMG
jgi:hypothetical protein